MFHQILSKDHSTQIKNDIIKSFLHTPQRYIFRRQFSKLETKNSEVTITAKTIDGNYSINVEITTNTTYYIEYQVNSTSGTWTKGTTAGAKVTATNLNSFYQQECKLVA